MDACPQGASASGAPALASGEGIFYLSTGEQVEFRPAEEGCPGALVEPALGFEGARAVARGDRLWVASSSEVVVYQGTTPQLTCPLGGVRSLAAGNGGKAWAVTGRGVVSLDASEASCKVGEPWSPADPRNEPGETGVVTPLLIAVGADGEGLWVVGLGQGCKQGLVVGGYRPDKTLDPATPSRGLDVRALGLRSVTALAEHKSSTLLLVDGTAGKARGGSADIGGAALAVRSTTGEVVGRWEAPAGQTPVAASPTEGGLVVMTASWAGSLQFFRAQF